MSYTKVPKTDLEIQINIGKSSLGNPSQSKSVIELFHRQEQKIEKKGQK